MLNRMIKKVAAKYIKAKKTETEKYVSTPKKITDLFGGTRKLKSLLGIDKFKKTDRGQGLAFSFKGKKGKPNHVRITRNIHTKLFKVVFKRVKKDGSDYKGTTPRKFDGVTFEKLRALFEKKTGVKLP